MEEIHLAMNERIAKQAVVSQAKGRLRGALKGFEGVVGGALGVKTGMAKPRFKEQGAREIIVRLHTGPKSADLYRIRRVSLCVCVCVCVCV